MMESEIDWTPLKPGGASFRTREFQLLDGKIPIVRSARLVWLVSFFAIFLFVFCSFFSIGIYFDSKSNSVLVASIFGLVASVIGVWYICWLVRKEVTVIDFDNKVYINNEDEISFLDIFGLQIIKEFIGHSSSRSFYSYELNFILKNGDRVNIIDHGDIDQVNQLASKIAERLDLKIWTHENKK